MKHRPLPAAIDKPAVPMAVAMLCFSSMAAIPLSGGSLVSRLADSVASSVELPIADVPRIAALSTVAHGDATLRKARLLSATIPPAAAESVGILRLGDVPVTGVASVRTFHRPSAPAVDSLRPGLDFPSAAASVEVPEAALRFDFPKLGLDGEEARGMFAQIVAEGLVDGTLDPADPRWRASLARLMVQPAHGVNSDMAFKLLIAGCGGGSEEESVAAAEKWAAGHEAGKYAGTFFYAAAKRRFDAGEYAKTVSMSDVLERTHPKLGIRAMLLKALAEAYSGDPAAAGSTMESAKLKYPDSPELPEVFYMEAWLALQDSREDDARAILAGIVRETPDSPAAAKAAQVLAVLEGAE